MRVDVGKTQLLQFWATEDSTLENREQRFQVSVPVASIDFSRQIKRVWGGQLSAERTVRASRNSPPFNGRIRLPLDSTYTKFQVELKPLI